VNKAAIPKEDLHQRRVSQLREMFAQRKERFPNLLAERFPHILERLLASWNNDDKTRHYFKTLLAKESRFGFPSEVLQEIFLLSKFYDTIHPPLHASRSDLWSLTV
jgi:hypothetical protein